MRCTVCGQESDQPTKFCPNCGAPMPEAESQQAQPVQPVQPTGSDQSAYVRPDYNPAQQGQPDTPQPATPVYTGQPKPSSTSQIVMAVINILCCGWGVSTVLGIIALVFAIMANSAPSYEEAANKLKTAKILNIIGLIMVGIFVIVIIIGLIVGFASIPFYYEYGY